MTPKKTLISNILQHMEQIKKEETASEGLHSRLKLIQNKINPLDNVKS